MPTYKCKFVYCLLNERKARNSDNMTSFFCNKVVLITGASSGIGKELAMQLAAQKAKLILIARREQVLQEVRTACLELTDDCHIIPFDLSETNKINELAAEALSVYGGIDVLINNAGVSQRSLTAETEMKVDRSIMELDYFAVIALTKAFLPHFIAKQKGNIIVISSVSGLMGFPMRSAYAAAKHALHGFFETLQTERPAKELYITIACPGRINTPISMSALKGNGGPHQMMDEGQLNGIPVDVCAKRILSAAAGKKKRVIIAQQERILLLLKRWIPALFFKIAHNRGMRQH